MTTRHDMRSAECNPFPMPAGCSQQGRYPTRDEAVERNQALMRSFDAAWRQPLPNPLTLPVVQRDPSLWERIADWWMTPRGGMLACIVSAAGVISLAVASAAH
jgi:hypothetical protein